MEDEIRYFVWEPSPLGPVARIWHGEQVDGNGKRLSTVGKPVELPKGDARTIDELKKAYSFEAKP